MALSMVELPTPHDNFLKGVQWSPDGVCLLTCADDNVLRVYDVPPEFPDDVGGGNTGDVGDARGGAGAIAEEALWPALRIKEREAVYDYAWFPAMNAADPQVLPPSTQFFLSLVFSFFLKSQATTHPVARALTTPIRIPHHSPPAPPRPTLIRPVSLPRRAVGIRYTCGTLSAVTYAPLIAPTITWTRLWLRSA